MNKQLVNNELTFENVKNGNYKLAYEVTESIGGIYERLTHAECEKDFNEPIRDDIKKFVDYFNDYCDPDLYDTEFCDVAARIETFDNLLKDYNKLLVKLRTKIFLTRKNHAERHAACRELYSYYGKRAKFIDSIMKVVNPQSYDYLKIGDDMGLIYKELWY